MTCAGEGKIIENVFCRLLLTCTMSYNSPCIPVPSYEYVSTSGHLSRTPCVGGKSMLSSLNVIY